MASFRIIGTLIVSDFAPSVVAGLGGGGCGEGIQVGTSA